MGNLVQATPEGQVPSGCQSKGLRPMLTHEQPTTPTTEKPQITIPRQEHIKGAPKEQHGRAEHTATESFSPDHILMFHLPGKQTWEEILLADEATPACSCKENAHGPPTNIPALGRSPEQKSMRILGMTSDTNPHPSHPKSVSHQLAAPMAKGRMSTPGNLGMSHKGWKHE